MLTTVLIFNYYMTITLHLSCYSLPILYCFILLTHITTKFLQHYYNIVYHLY
jgi:hypothetical protein